MWQTGDLAKFRGRSSTELLLLIEAVLWLAIARAAILAIPFRWTTRLFALKRGVTAISPDPVMLAEARGIGQAVRTAAARTPWQSTCLAQSLAGAAMLRRRRIPAAVAMGVSRSSGAGEFTAHAWLCCGGLIITGARGHERYQVIANWSA